MTKKDSQQNHVVIRLPVVHFVKYAERLSITYTRRGHTHNHIQQITSTFVEFVANILGPLWN